LGISWGFPVHRLTGLFSVWPNSCWVLALRIKRIKGTRGMFIKCNSKISEGMNRKYLKINENYRNSCLNRTRKTRETCFNPKKMSSTERVDVE
jgi:hypothetical protein